MSMARPCRSFGGRKRPGNEGTSVHGGPTMLLRTRERGRERVPSRHARQGIHRRIHPRRPCVSVSGKSCLYWEDGRFSLRLENSRGFLAGLVTGFFYESFTL